MQLAYVNSTSAAQLGLGDLSASLATVQMGANLRLIASAHDSNALASLSLGAAPSAAFQGDIAFAPQLGPDFGWQITADLPRMFNISAQYAPLQMNTISAAGTPNAAQIVAAPGGGTLTGVAAVQVLEFASGDWLALARAQSAGLVLHRLSDSGALSQTVTLPDTDKTYLAGVSDTATLARGSDQLLLAISALENGISSYRVSANGAVEWIDSLGAHNGLPVNGLAMMQTVQIGGIDFVIMAATNSSSLTVLRVNPMGVFFETDHLIDTRDTRFDKIMAFDSFVAQGRFFVVAGGADSGLTLLELLPGGTLSHVKTFVLEGGAGLTAISGIKTQVMGAQVAVFLVDSGADQIFRFDLDITALGARLSSSGGGVTGTSADERILGSAMADTLDGGGGDDFIHDGAGADTLRGRAGADVFVFARDGALDVIADFQTGIDRIDVSAWGRIYSASALQISQTATGAEVIYGDERLIIHSMNGAPLTALGDNDFLF